MSYLKSIVFLFICISGLSSCNLIGKSYPKPNKSIKMTVSYSSNVTEQERENIVISITKRLEIIGKKPKIERRDAKNELNIEIATNYEVNRVKRIIETEGKIQLFDVFKREEMMPFFKEVNALISNEDDPNNLFKLFVQERNNFDQILFYVKEKDTAQVFSYLQMQVAQSSLPSEKKYIKFVWGKEDIVTKSFPLYAIKIEKDPTMIFNGQMIKNANQSFGQLGNPSIHIEMNEEGAKLFEKLTQRVFEEQSNIAIVFDDIVYTAPSVSSPIKEGRVEISNAFSQEEAQDLAMILNSGAISGVQIENIEVEQL
ncbi:SecDF P1 head subdomain-containing protein [Aquimarina algicola]|uniref:SecDF P1 head subdomain domain-containing protein n=1 Tax=Aquimarina algicola TaxID=2589995 RepID=A0A504J3Q6_9FLAO|nr:hypothetical protein [Aquimarina algicola]TPN81719.1 hypothetical protein FHK87_24275 [Aquimarina algicola]